MFPCVSMCIHFVVQVMGPMKQHVVGIWLSNEVVEIWGSIIWVENFLCVWNLHPKGKIHMEENSLGVIGCSFKFVGFHPKPFPFGSRMRDWSHLIWLFDIISSIKMNCLMRYSLLGVGGIYMSLCGQAWVGMTSYCTFHKLAQEVLSLTLNMNLIMAKT